ncbi:hypothetical protein ACI01nite_25500 [Acetobacter cibinongensis]|uniref:Conjugal transfer protein TrbJ n=1 Tax=Acetobacter cibinongensis TaxID=146475 RepID=A0A0D6N7N8_9PROT|nr:P-type conjugative transfer protein TrbJ [Acetobacter cibinongensis]GAN61705.1 conjugal transfer protein TrbJ [Acetobacter cibinongensis]GBQ15500.1 conjugal transfer protein TrbJ [Acetobacter cibinongensis NRIC 0482]GEL59948.1 hypothetical protein ACI01nite_25500 [Acetobacter cibinongensis]
MGTGESWREPDRRFVVSGPASPRDQRDLMGRPFFALARRPRFEPVRYRSRQIDVIVRASADEGNLASLPLSTLSTLQSTISQTTALLAQAQNIAYSVQSVEQQYQQAYTSVSSGMSDSALFSQAQTRWQNSVGGFEDALKLQARVVGNIPTDSSAMTQLVSASQTSTGALQAAQAGNQLLALQSRQLSDIQAELAANGRATALQQAREAVTEAESEAQYQHFSRHDAYVPGTVSMFGSSGN